MRRRIALQKHFVRKSLQRLPGFAELSECARVFASLFAHRGFYKSRSLLPTPIMARGYALLPKE